VQPLSAGVEQDVPFLATEFVFGDSLDTALKRYGPAPAADTARLVAQIAAALDAAASIGLAHGRLNPRDLLVTPELVRVTGVGVASCLESVGVSSPVAAGYASPERLAHRAWNRWADIYSLAAIAWELLTGRRLSAPGVPPIPDVSSVSVARPEHLRLVLSQALAADAAARYPSARDFAAALEIALTGRSSRVTPSAEPEAAVPPDLAAERAARRRPVRQPRERHVAPGEAHAMAAPVEAEPAAEPRDDTPVQAPPEPAPAIPPASERGPEPPVIAEPIVEAPAPVVVVEPTPMALETPMSIETPPVAIEAPVEPGAAQAHALDAGTLGRDPAGDAPAGLLSATRYGDVDARSPDAPLDLPLVAPGEPGPADLPFGTPSEPEPPPVVRRPRVRPLRRPPPAEPPEEMPVFLQSQPQQPQSESPALPPSDLHRRPDWDRWQHIGLWVIGAVFVGFLIGLVGGYWVGQRTAAPAGTAVRPVESSSAAIESGKPAVRPVTPGGSNRPLPGPSAPPTQPPASPPAAPAAAPSSTPPTAAAGRVTPAPAPVAPPSTRAPVTSAPPVKAPQPTRPAAAKPAGSGRLTVRSTPSGATVFVNGVERGKTPITVGNLPFRAFTVRLTRSGYVAYQRQVSLSAARPSGALTATLRLQSPPARRDGAPAPTTAAPATAPSATAPTTARQTTARASGFEGSLTINSRPAGARVFLDDASVGTTPLSLNAVPAGSHVVRVEREGYKRVSTVVRVVAGQRADVQLTLDPESGR